MHSLCAGVMHTHTPADVALFSPDRRQTKSAETAPAPTEFSSDTNFNLICSQGKRTTKRPLGSKESIDLLGKQL